MAVESLGTTIPIRPAMPRILSVCLSVWHRQTTVDLCTGVLDPVVCIPKGLRPSALGWLAEPTQGNIRPHDPNHNVVPSGGGLKPALNVSPHEDGTALRFNPVGGIVPG